ncbi:MAG: DUF4332 domain-containing protein [Propionibacteriaceae bacterium]
MTTPTPDRPIVRADVLAASLPSFRPVGTDEIITIGDRTGIFTPLTGKDADNTENLSKIVQVLRSELAEARADNAGLQAKLDELTTPARSADNLAEGVQSALDGLADRLGAMTNATSNFAVREFTLESKVHVDVTAVGTIGFQFVRPGETVNAAALSTVTLTVVPVPKPMPDVVAGEPFPAVHAADASLEAIDGLSRAQAAALRGAHITTTSEFARVATRATATAELVSMLGVTRSELGRFTLLAGLLTVPDLDGTKARVLYEAGIRDVATLAGTTPAKLMSRYAKAAAAVDGAGRWRPKAEDAEAWIAAAKALTA